MGRQRCRRLDSISDRVSKRGSWPPAGVQAVRGRPAPHSWASTLITTPFGSRTKKRRTPQGSSTGIVDHLVSTVYRLGVRGVNGRPRAHVDAHVGQDGLNARGCEDDLRLARAEADVATAEAALLELEHSGIEGAGGVEVARLVVGDDPTDGHRDSLAAGSVRRPRRQGERWATAAEAIAATGSACGQRSRAVRHQGELGGAGAT